MNNKGKIWIRLNNLKRCMSKTNKLKDKSQSGEIFAIYKTDK